MNKVLVTGLGSAKELGLCETCNLNFSWLTSNPSTILWADQICIPRGAFEAHKANDDNKEDKVISLFLKMAERNGIIDKIDVSDRYREHVGDEIHAQMLKDSQMMLKTFPETVQKGHEKVPYEIIIEGEGYCGAWMSSIYADMRIANDIEANCLFSPREHTFLKYLYGLEASKYSGSAINSAYNEIFSLYMPENIALHNYAFSDEEKCQSCLHYDECKDSYLSETEKAIEKMLRWRDYDELHQAKEEISKIVRAKNEICSMNDVNDIVSEFKEKQDKINRNIHKRFPKIERWTKMTTVIATPITIASAVTGNVPLSIGSAVVTGMAQATQMVLDIYKSKNNWVGFVNSMKGM